MAEAPNAAALFSSRRPLLRRSLGSAFEWPDQTRGSVHSRTGIDLIARQIGPKLAERLGRPSSSRIRPVRREMSALNRWCVRRPMARRCS